MRTVDSIIARIREADRNRSQLLNDASYRREKIRAWLTASDGHTFGNEELDSLSQDPPLFFFVLFEAAHTQDGERLGILGSIIAAEIFFAAYKKKRPRQSKTTARGQAGARSFSAAIYRPICLI